jgi:MFS family permease
MFTGIVGLVAREPILLWGGLLVVRSLLGMTNAPLHPAGARLVSNWLPQSAVILGNGMVTFAGCVGMGIVYVAFGNLIDGFGWPRAFLVTGGITLLLAVGWIVWADDGRPHGGQPQLTGRRTSDSHNFWSLLAHPSLLNLTISYATVGYFQYLFFYWMEYYFEKILRLNLETSRWLSTAMVLAMGLGMVIGGRLADIRSSRGGRNGHRLVPVVCLLASAVCVVLAVASTSNHWKIALFMVSMAAVGGTEGSYWTQAVVIGRARGGTAAAIMNTGGNLGGLLAPVVTPFVAAHLGWQLGMGLASVVCAIGAVLWYWIDMPEKRT